MKRALRGVVGCALLATVGCVQILGLHDRSEAASDGPSNSELGGADANPTVAGQCGPLLHSSASCASCMDKGCCAEARACAADAACNEASDCLAACADATCQAQCNAFYTLPDTLIALRACRLHQCSAACGNTCGEFASSVMGCEACERSSCCGLAETCATNTSCASLSLCESNCFGAASCPTNCENKNGAGVSDFGALQNCMGQCATACQPGQSWGCLDSPMLWPKPKVTGSINFSVTFVDLTGEEPFVGATVKACQKFDFTCASPLAMATTDSTGLVSLTVPAGLSGFDGYLDVTGGHVPSSGAAVYPSIWYPVPFVIADGWRGRSQLVSVDESVLLTTATGVTLDPTRGHFGVNAVDCAFTSAAGVSFSVDIADSKTVGYYSVGGVPVTTAVATDQSGNVAFLNLPVTSPARLAVVHAYSGDAHGKSMGSLTYVIRAGTFTTGSSFPPAPQ